jgi:membrane-bound inhibitor of C-type lysozyme
MTTLRSCSVAASLTLLTIACADRASQQAPPAETASDVAAPAETVRVEGWWGRGDFVGPFTAELVGDDIVAIDRDLSHGEYGTTRDRFEFESGRLVSYRQDSQYRLMDPEDPSRLVPVSMRLEFDDSGALIGGTKTVDGADKEPDATDLDRVQAQVDDLVEQARAFAEVAADGGDPVQFVCPDDRSFRVTFGDEAVVLDLGDGYGRHVLVRQPAASGARYGNELYLFWTKGDEAMVEAFGEPFLSGCLAQE